MKQLSIAFLSVLVLGPPPASPVERGPAVLEQYYSGWPMRNPVRQIFRVNQTFTWLREPLLRRLPDGSPCCVLAMYPDAFYEDQSSAVYLAWEDGETIFFQIIPMEELN